MTAISTRAHVRAALRAGTLREQLDRLPDLDLLRLPDEVVLALPPEIITWRRDKLLASNKAITSGQIKTFLRGNSEANFARLRNNYLKTGRASRNALLAPDEELSDDDIRRPGDGKTGRLSGSPRWRLADFLHWLIQYERVDEDHPDTLILRSGVDKGGRPSSTDSARAEVTAGA